MKKAIDIKKETPSISDKKALLDWELEEIRQRPKNLQIGIIIFLIFFFLFVIWQKNYLGFILGLVMSFMLFYQPTTKKTYFAILKNGARREKELFPWYNLESFWIFEDPPSIYFKSKKTYLPYHIIFPLPENYIKRARRIMSGFIKEKEEEKNFFDVVNESLGL